MSWTVFAAVLLAALLHAGWNALVRGSADRFVAMNAIVIGHVPIGLVAMATLPIPKAESWAYVLASAILHAAYQLFLLLSYRFGDLTQVYPIARGSAPLMVAVVSAMFLGVVFAPMQIAAIAAIGVGVSALVFAKRPESDGVFKAGGLALITGGFIASYSLFDGLGARLAGHSVAFYGWVTVLNALTYLAVVALIKPKSIPATVSTARSMIVLGGGGSFVAYAIVTWAFTQAPIALVTALRETSVVFATIFGVVFLKEKVGLARVAAISVVLAGLFLLRLATI